MRLARAAAPPAPFHTETCRTECCPPSPLKAFPRVKTRVKTHRTTLTPTRQRRPRRRPDRAHSQRAPRPAAQDHKLKHSGESRVPRDFSRGHPVAARTGPWRRPFVPGSPCGRSRARLPVGSPGTTAPSNGLTACGMRSACCLRGFGLPPLRHCGNTLAPAPARDYAPSLRSPWRAAEDALFSCSSQERAADRRPITPFLIHSSIAFSIRRPIALE
jgi:hypothetical protein